MADWTVTVTVNVTVTVTLTLNLTLTLNKEKGKCFDSNFCLNHILKWKIMCEASVGVLVKNVALFSRTIFS